MIYIFYGHEVWYRLFPAKIVLFAVFQSCTVIFYKYRSASHDVQNLEAVTKITIIFPIKSEYCIVVNAFDFSFWCL